MTSATSETSAIAHLERLVGFATVSRDSNLELIEYVRADLAGLGIGSELVASEDGRKANLFATIGPADRPGVVLSGHTDVVPCEGQAWTSDPFALRRDDGRLYGRGTADMKGFIACCLAMARDAVGRRLATPIHFAFSYDEEIGCIGVRRLLDMLSEMPVRPRFCIVGEPTLMQVATAHKGKASWRVVAHGLEAHSSLAPDGVNAIHLAVDLIGRIRAMQDEIARSGGRDGDYDVPYTTLHIGIIAGGETINIVPNRATFDFEIRYLPGDDIDGMFRRIEAAADEIAAVARARFAGAKLEFEPLVSYPALDTAPDEEVVAFVKSLTGANAITKISFGTEGGLYQERLGVPSVVCGPGAIAVAHKPDEYVETSQLEACTGFLARLVDRLAE
jgi:acetylornithine deacetylase